MAQQNNDEIKQVKTYKEMYDCLIQNHCIDGTDYRTITEEFGVSSLDNIGLDEINFDKYGFPDWQVEMLEGLLFLCKNEDDQALISFYQSNGCEENPDALFELANYYDRCTDTKRNADRAFKYAKLAYEKGAPRAINLLAHYYQIGIGVEKNSFEAIKLYRKMFDDGDEIRFFDVLNSYKNLSAEERYEFYKSLLKTSLIYKALNNHEEYALECSYFESNMNLE